QAAIEVVDIEVQLAATARKYGLPDECGRIVETERTQFLSGVGVENHHPCGDVGVSEPIVGADIDALAGGKHRYRITTGDGSDQHTRFGINNEHGGIGSG